MQNYPGGARPSRGWKRPQNGAAARNERHGQLQIFGGAFPPTAPAAVGAVSDRPVQGHPTAGGHWYTASPP